MPIKYVFNRWLVSLIMNSPSLDSNSGSGSGSEPSNSKLSNGGSLDTDSSDAELDTTQLSHSKQRMFDNLQGLYHGNINNTCMNYGNIYRFGRMSIEASDSFIKIKSWTILGSELDVCINKNLFLKSLNNTKSINIDRGLTEERMMFTHYEVSEDDDSGDKYDLHICYQFKFCKDKLVAARIQQYNMCNPDVLSYCIELTNLVKGIGHPKQPAKKINWNF